MYNILLGGAAGDGIETMAMLLERALKQAGYYVFTIRDVMPRVRGGHNFVQIRFGNEAVSSHCDALDGIFAMNEETLINHHSELKKDGFIMADSSQDIADPRVILLPLHETAKRLGNSKVATSVAIGALLSLFGTEIKYIRDLLDAHLKQNLVAINMAAIQQGYELIDARFYHKARTLDNHILLSGSSAAALGAAAAGLKFYAGYPMSPSTEVLDYFLQFGESLDMVVNQAEDEIAAIHMAIGAAYAGSPAMCGSSGGGFCLMVEAVGFAGMAEIPLVVMDVQRPGPATGLPTRTEQSDLNFAIHAAQGEFPRMVIALRHHEDAFYQMARAVGLAQKYQIPIIILSDQYLGDSTATIPLLDIDKIYKNIIAPENFSYPYKTYEYTQSGISTRVIPGKSKYLLRIDSDEHDEFGVITESANTRNQMMDKRMGKLSLLEMELLEPEFIGNEQCTILLVGFGSVYGPLKEAITALNMEEGKYGALLFGDVYPLPVKLLREYASKSCRVISVEQNATGQFASLIREATLIECTQSILKYDGRQMTSLYIRDAVCKLQRG